MRVDELSLEVELESVAKLNILRSKSDGEVLTLLDELSGEKWIKNSVDVLANRFDHKNITIGDSHLDFL